MGLDVRLLTAFGDDVYAQKLAAVCGELGIDISQSPVIPGGHTSTYLFINDQQGDMQLAVSDMDIYRNLTPRVLAGRKQLLEDAGISARVIDLFTIKPLDAGAVTAAARETGAVLTAENHSVYNGLGSAVAEVLAERRLAVPFGRIGFRDVTGETADVPYILKKFGMDAPAIAGLAKELVALK